MDNFKQKFNQNIVNTGGKEKMKKMWNKYTNLSFKTHRGILVISLVMLVLLTVFCVRLQVRYYECEKQSEAREEAYKEFQRVAVEIFEDKTVAYIRYSEKIYVLNHDTFEVEAVRVSDYPEFVELMKRVVGEETAVCVYNTRQDKLTIGCTNSFEAAEEMVERQFQEYRIQILEELGWAGDSEVTPAD